MHTFLQCMNTACSPRMLGEHQPAPRLRDGAAELGGGLDPLGHNRFEIAQCLAMGLAIGHAAWQFRSLGDECLILGAPVNDDFVLQAHYGSSLYLRITLRTCRT